MKPSIIVIAAAVIIGAFLLFRGRPSQPPATTPAGSNVSVVDGTQIVTVKAKGGYQPGTSTVKAGMPTILRFETNATYDCSSEVRIPSLGIEKVLPPAGMTDIALGTLKPGILPGTCGMGMYRFILKVQG
jgi:plastocyanin domain-containing protein